MDSAIEGKLTRVNHVWGVFFSPDVEDFFQSVSDGNSERTHLFPSNNVELYQSPSEVLRDIGINGRPNAPLRAGRNEVNLHFLRAVGIGDDHEWENPVEVIRKWAPPNSPQRGRWEEYAQAHGYEEDDIPPPPGLVFSHDQRYSNEALKSVMKSMKDAVHEISKQFIQPVEISFNITIDDK